jgi:predicted outer membrane protein
MISRSVNPQSSRRLQRFVAAAFAALVCVSAFVVSHAQTPPAMTSADFVRDASEHFTTQLEAARVAQTKSTDAAVKSLASRVAAEAEQANRALVKLTGELKIDLPSRSRANPAAAGVAPRAPQASRALDSTQLAMRPIARTYESDPFAISVRSFASRHDRDSGMHS